MANSAQEQSSTSDVSKTVRELPLATNRIAAGSIAPIIGRVALSDVNGYYGFSLIKKGEHVTQTHIDRAQHLGRLFELIAATEAN